MHDVERELAVVDAGAVHAEEGSVGPGKLSGEHPGLGQHHGAALANLYAGLGWGRVGIIPGYALWPDGRPCDTTVFYKSL